MSLPSWDLQSFAFGWNLNITKNEYTIPQCSSVTLQYWGSINNRIVNPPPTPPYNLVLYSGGFEPWTISLNNSDDSAAATGITQWLAELPVGPVFAVSMKDSRGYSGGLMDATIRMTPVAGCDAASLLKASSLSINMDGSYQCREALVTVNNGVPPYTLEVIPLGGNYKTIHFALSPLRLTLDMSAGMSFWCTYTYHSHVHIHEFFSKVAVSDSQGSSGVKGPYLIDSSPDNSCLGLATTVTAGRFSTLYPGGTARPTEVGGVPSPSSATTFTNAAVVMAVLIPLLAIAIAMALLWLCFRHSSRYYPFERERPRVGYPNNYISEYTPVPAAESTVPTMDTLDRSSSSTSPHTSSNMSHTRVLVNPNSHYLGPIEIEPLTFGTVEDLIATKNRPSAT
ncbi:unnamed protein product [Rhizoctonia solani]|uniref:Transmembrane protein n=1 Tax=Rhizoctonia solani TaxID=456999 RepID=A0A8H3H325_9AGAM|nr:unnamed protein product [Rhizoctonia solani]CAE6481295.1 unnamed protein product [Rhizoctonia solani]